MSMEVLWAIDTVGQFQNRYKEIVVHLHKIWYKQKLTQLSTFGYRAGQVDLWTTLFQNVEVLYGYRKEVVKLSRSGIATLR